MCSRSSVDNPGARTLVFVAFEPFLGAEFRASIVRTPFCAILWRSPNRHSRDHLGPQSKPSLSLRRSPWRVPVLERRPEKKKHKRYAWMDSEESAGGTAAAGKTGRLHSSQKMLHTSILFWELIPWKITFQLHKNGAHPISWADSMQKCYFSPSFIAKNAQNLQPPFGWL